MDLCLYNSGVRANKVYDAPLTYGDFVAEVPFENNIITLDMHGEDIYRALSYSESTKTETCSWGGYLLWDDDIDVRPMLRTRRTRETSSFPLAVNRSTSIASIESRRGLV